MLFLMFKFDFCFDVSLFWVVRFKKCCTKKLGLSDICSIIEILVGNPVGIGSTFNANYEENANLAVMIKIG